MADTTPREAAEAEAARQAVALIFGVAGTVVMLWAYKRIARQQATVMREAMTTGFDPVLRRVAEAEAVRARASRSLRRWQRAAGSLWPVSSAAALWALRHAERAAEMRDKAGQ